MLLLGIYSISLVTHPIALVCAFPFFLFSNSSIAITQPLLEMNQWFGRLKVWENRFCSPFSKSNLLSPHSQSPLTSSFNVHHQGTVAHFRSKKCHYFEEYTSKIVHYQMYIFAPILTTVQERDKRSLSQSSVNNDTLLHA